MQSGEKMFTVDKFLGLNEAADGYTELNLGEASRMENFTITDGCNLKLRPGVRRIDFYQDRDEAPILATWAGHISQSSAMEHMVVVDFKNGHDRIWLYTRIVDGGYTAEYSQIGALGLDSTANPMIKVFAFGGKLYIMSRANTVIYDGEQFVTASPYIPLVIAGADPAGGGTTLEKINLLSSFRRITYSADGQAVAYVLPVEAERVDKIIIDNVEASPASLGAYNVGTHTFTFNAAPVRGVGNVEIVYDTDHAETEANRLLIASMPLVEAYNGSTDTRLFVGGVGNKLYYTGVPQTGEVTAMYFPAQNYVSVDMTGAEVTGIVRHYSKLLVFTRDGTYTISYEPVTLTDGSTIAGFYLRAANKEFGNDVCGQVQTVNNFPRTITSDGIYEWRITASYYQDERYAKRVSDAVQKTLSGADIQKIVTCDNSFDKTYYAFLNDRMGTVLVNRYNISKDGMWTVYNADVLRDIQNAFIFNGQVFFANDNDVFCFDDGFTTDVNRERGGEAQKINAVWESGYMDFGADFRRKFASQIYVSLLPASNSELTITAKTDRREEYMEKKVSSNVFDWRNVNFATWTFDTRTTPRIQKVRLKVKKFVYYKLIFRIDTMGATATVLGYDQLVRFGSMAK